MQNTKKRMVSLIVFIAIIFLTLTGCSGKKPKVRDPAGPVALGEGHDAAGAPVPVYKEAIKELLDGGLLDNELATLFSQPDDYELPEPDTFANIRQKYLEGKISAQAQAKLLLLAAYAPELVPDSYQGAAGPVESPQFATQYLVDNWAILSLEEKEAVTPFLVPITDPASFWHPDRKEKTSRKVEFPGTSVAYAAGGERVLVVNAFEVGALKVEITYYEQSSWDTDQKLTYNMCIKDIEDAIRLGFAKFEELLGMAPAGSLLVELIPLREGLNGVAWSCGDGTYRIRLSTSLVDSPARASANSARAVPYFPVCHEPPL